MLVASMELRVFQTLLGVLSLIPILGLVIAFGPGPAFFFDEGATVPIDLDSQWRYLSGAYVSVSLAIWWTIPQVETRLAPLRIASIGVMLGGLGRLVSIFWRGFPDDRSMVAGLFLELGVVPLLLLWQIRIQRRHAAAGARSES